MVKRRSFLMAVAAAALLMAGCGGSSTSSPGTGEDNITRATEGDFSESARILAAEEANKTGDVWLSADVARRFDADLTTIRTASPAVNGVTAFPIYDLHKIVVAVSSDAPWLDKWRSGVITTGDPGLDGVLAEFGPDKVTPREIGAVNGNYYFVLEFVQSLNMRPLAQRIKASSTSVVSSSPDLNVGGGDNIGWQSLGTDGSRTYTLSRGWGDCAAGCIFRHSWKFSVSSDSKTVALTEESGAPLLP